MSRQKMITCIAIALEIAEEKIEKDFDYLDRLMKSGGTGTGEAISFLIDYDKSLTQSQLILIWKGWMETYERFVR